jgi:hypothetical protein
MSGQQKHIRRTDSFLVELVPSRSLAAITLSRGQLDRLGSQVEKKYAATRRPNHTVDGNLHSYY